MFNPSNTYRSTTTSCVCYTLAVHSYWEKASTWAEVYMLVVEMGRREVFKEKPGCESSPGKGAGKGHQKRLCWKEVQLNTEESLGSALPLCCSMWQHQRGGDGMVSPGDSPLLSAACYQSTEVGYLQVLVYTKGPTKMSWQQDYHCLVGSSFSLEAVGSAWSQEAAQP